MSPSSAVARGAREAGTFEDVAAADEEEAAAAIGGESAVPMGPTPEREGWVSAVPMASAETPPVLGGIGR
eukprot:8982212-Prorocentrum_lima.AAC.1